MPMGLGLSLDLVHRQGGGVPVVPSLAHWAHYGQSLSIGAAAGGTPAVISGPMTGHYMLVGGVRVQHDQLAGAGNVNSYTIAAGMASLATLQETTCAVETTAAETFASGIASVMTETTLHTATGRSAYTVALLSRDALYHFANTYAAVLAARERARENNLVYKLPGIVFAEGEADGSGSTSKATFKTQVLQLLTDFRSHLKHAAQMDLSDLPLIFPYQQSYQQTGTTYHDIAVAVIELHRENPGDIICVGPAYQQAYYTAISNVHFTSQSYQDYGEFPLGPALKTIMDGGVYHPCHINSAPTRSGTNLDIPVWVPVPPLIKDTSLITAIANDGFTYSGATINSVTILDDGTGDNQGVIRLALSTGAGGNLGYAYNNGTTLRVGPVSGPRGKILDSGGHWLCIDQWTGIA